MARYVTKAEEREMWAYLQKFNAYQGIVDRAQFDAVFAAYRSGSKDALAALVNANIRLAASVARRYVDNGLSLTDLTQEGVIGLMKALETYHPASGFSFSTHANNWIRQKIVLAVIERSGRFPFRLPVYFHQRVNAVRMAHAIFTERFHRQPNDFELFCQVRNIGSTIGAEMSMWQTVQAAQCLRLQSVPMDRVSRWKGGDHATIGDLITAVLSGAHDATDYDRLLKACMAVYQRIVAHLDHEAKPRHAMIIRRRFGFEGAPPMTLKQIGDIDHVSDERIRQLQNEGLATLKKRLGVDEHLLKVILHVQAALPSKAA